MSGQTLRRADIPLPGGDEAVYNSSGLQGCRHADRLGSAPLISSPGGGVISSIVYTPFGYAETGSGIGYRSFTGQKQDIDNSHSGGQYDLLMREYNPIQGRWWTQDPAGLAAVDPNNPQSWNRYAYVGGMPLEYADPLGLHAQACTTDSCSWQDPVGCTLDGMSIGCEMVQNWAEMAGGGGGGGGGGIVPCPGDCSGFRALEGPGGTTTYQEWQNATLVNSRITIGGVVTDATGTYTPGHWQTIGSSDSCGWDLDCQAFVGIVDLVLNEKPSGALRLGGARAVGVVVSRSAAALSAAAHWYCGPDPSSRILKSMGTGAALGAVTGGFAGFTAGELFGGELTLGLTGVPGAALGGFLGGTVGAMNGIAYGVGSAIACNAAGFYN